MTEREESGQVTVLVIGFAVLLLMMVGVVVDSSAAYLQRQSLDTLADGAALAGADEVRGTTVYSGGLDGERIPLDRAAARDAVAAYFSSIRAYDDHPGLTFDVAVRDQSVVVRLTAPLDLPITVDGLTDTHVTARGAAVVEIDG